MKHAAAQDELATLLSAFDELLLLDDTDTILRRAVELALDPIGLMRVGLFLLDEPRNLMLGTWGTDLDGRVVEGEHAPSSDTEAQAYVYRHLPHVGGVVHTHSPYAVAWAARGEAKA